MNFPLNLDQAARLVRSGRAVEVVASLAAAVRRSDTIGPVHALHFEALLVLGERQAALSALEAALQLPRHTADEADTLAFFARQMDRHELSNTLYWEAANLAPGDPQAWYNLATSERSLGRLTEAAEACERALVLDPDMRSAAALRSEVTRASDAVNHVDDLRSRIARTADPGAAIPLHFALGKELHELKRYDEAFDAFHRGAQARRASLRYDVAQDEHKLRRIAEAFPDAAKAPAGERPSRHVFIVGMPRSGTTLTERILGGLADVRSNNETNNFAAALFRNAPAQGGDMFDRAARADFTAVARDYDALAASDGYRGCVLEKLPFNYLYVGPILQALPEAPIIWVRRNPLDSCFAMYRTLFGAAYPFSYDFAELARYFAAYDRLMRHWSTLFGERLTVIDYEDLVADPARIGAYLAARCGLSWDDQALDLSRNTSVSLTASASQVRGAIYATSSGAWRHYQRHLTPLAEALARAGVVPHAD